MNRCYKISLIYICVIASAILAHAETDNDFLKKCSEGKISAENRIEFCTKALEGEITIENKAAVYNNRGIAYRELKQYLNAVNDHSKAIELDPKFANAYNSRGNTYFQSHKYNKAIEDYNKAIELDPKYAHAYNDRGAVYCSLKQYGKALKDYNMAIELDSTDANYYNGRGNVYYFLRDYAKAIEDYTKAIEINPKYANAYYNRCFAHCYYLTQYDKALEDCNKAIELEPANADNFHGRGIIYCYLKQYDKALDDFTKAISLDPKNTDSYSTRGIVHYLTNKTDKSDADFKKADELFDAGIKTDPVNPVLYNRRGWNYLWMQKWEQARDALEKAIVLDPGDAESYVNLADYWWAYKRDKNKSLENLEISFKKGFDFWDDLYSDVWDGHFLKDLNNTPEFKGLVDKYRKSASSQQEMKNKIFVIKEWLKDLSPKDRANFMDGMMIKNGHVASVSIRHLERNLSEERVNKIVYSFKTDDSLRQKRAKDKKVSLKMFFLSELLKDVPVKTKNSFLDNMMFKNGAVVSVNIKKLKKAVSKERLNEILSSLANPYLSNPEIENAGGHKVVCGNGFCLDAVCACKSNEYGKTDCKCEPEKKQACYTECEDYPNE